MGLGLKHPGLVEGEDFGEEIPSGSCCPGDGELSRVRSSPAASPVAVGDRGHPQGHVGCQTRGVWRGGGSSPISIPQEVWDEALTPPGETEAQQGWVGAQLGIKARILTAPSHFPSSQLISWPFFDFLPVFSL